MSADAVDWALEAIGAIATGATVELVPDPPHWRIDIDGQPVADFSSESTARAVHRALVGPRLVESPPESFRGLPPGGAIPLCSIHPRPGDSRRR